MAGSLDILVQPVRWVVVLAQPVRWVVLSVQPVRWVDSLGAASEMDGFFGTAGDMGWFSRYSR